MSATNTTTNYSLPIFIETDKPAWLVDFNGAMRTIDATLKTNADAIATKSPILTFNDTNEIDFTKTGDIVTAHLASGVSDKVGRALVAPVAAPAAEQIVSINTNGAQDVIEIGSGLFNDNGTLKAIDLNLNDTGVSSFTSLPTGVTASAQMNYAFNADKSVGKLYGVPTFKKSTSGDASYSIDTGIDVPAPSEYYAISPAGCCFSGTAFLGGAYYEITTSGRLYLHCWVKGGNANTYVYLFPCIYFFKDFGDTPTS